MIVEDPMLQGAIYSTIGWLSMSIFLRKFGDYFESGSVMKTERDIMIVEIIQLSLDYISDDDKEEFLGNVDDISHDLDIDIETVVGNSTISLEDDY